MEVHRRRGDHADDLSRAVHQRPARVARPHRGRNLDQPADFLRAARQRVFGVDGPIECGHRTGLVGEGSADAVSVAETDGRLANHNLCGVSDGCRRQPACAAQLEHRDVVLAVVADEICRVVAPAHGAGDCVGARDDVVVRQHHAAGIDDRAGPGSDGLLVVDLRGDLDDGRRDRRSGRLRVGWGGQRCRWYNQGQDRGERDQQRGQRMTQTGCAHLPIVPELRSANSPTAHSTL